MVRIVFLLCLLFFGTVSFAQISINIENLKVSEGKIFVAVYNNSNHFLNIKKAVHTAVYEISKDNTVFSLPPLPSGKYAVSLFLDEDKNEELTTFLGIPKEPYGFSNNKNGSILGPPNFEETHFYYDGTEKKLNIALFRLV